MPSPTSSRKDPSENSHPLVNGASTLLPSQEAPASSMSASFGASTTGTNGRPSRSDSTPKTLREPLEERASKEQTSPSSTPTSPNYFDLLSDMEDNTEAPPLPAAKTQLAKKKVRFTDQPQVNNPRPALTGTHQGEAPRRPVRSLAGTRTTGFAAEIPKGAGRKTQGPGESRQPP